MRLGLVTEPFDSQPLPELLDWLVSRAPQVTELELVAGGYGPTHHCNRRALLDDASARSRWLEQIERRGLRVAALNCWGNPLHPDPDVAGQQDVDLRETIRLASALGVNRLVALAGCPGAGPDDRRAPHFAGGGWLPDLAGVSEWQWQDRVLPYWADVADFAHREHPDLRICLELHPGTCVYNVETFGRIAQVGPNIAANVDPSHFFWQRIDPFAVVQSLGEMIGHAHAKDLAFNDKALAINGLLDRRWPDPPDQMPWNFSTVGRAHNAEWWRRFAEGLTRSGSLATLAIEHEDPFVLPSVGVPEAAAVLTQSGVLDQRRR